MLYSSVNIFFHISSVNSYPCKISARKQRKIDSGCRDFNRMRQEDYFFTDVGL
jgi:hypothetical protein